MFPVVPEAPVLPVGPVAPVLPELPVVPSFPVGDDGGGVGMRRGDGVGVWMVGRCWGDELFP